MVHFAQLLSLLSGWGTPWRLDAPTGDRYGVEIPETAFWHFSHSAVQFARYQALTLRGNVTSRPRVGPDPMSVSGVASDASLKARVKATTEDIERRSIALALEKSAGNRTAAAKMLGMSRQNLHTKLNKYDIWT